LHAFCDTNPELRFFLTFTVTGELACGTSRDTAEKLRRLVKPYPVIPWSEPVSVHYGLIFRRLKAEGRLIGTNDLWIAATALAHRRPVVTNNVAEFSRVEGLDVIAFQARPGC